MHHHHHAITAAQAFTKFGVTTHHGTGLLVFWAIVLPLALVTVVASRGNRHKRQSEVDAARDRVRDAEDRFFGRASE